MLEFTYRAELVLGDQTRSFAGTVAMSKWKHRFLPTKSEAAWALVRGLLDQAGVWNCEIRLAGQADARTVDVMNVGGTLYRRDRARVPGAG